MFRVHCNKCFSHRSKDQTMVFNMTRCQHVICKTCVTESSSEKKCPICKQELHSIPINGNLPRGVACYFEDPLQFLGLYRKISKFQTDQRASDNLGFYRQMQEHEKNKLRLDGFGKMEAQINQQIEIEKKRIDEHRAYISYHEEAVQKTKRSSMDDQSQTRDFQKPRINQRRRGVRPRTPSISTSNNSQSDVVSFLDSDTDFPTICTPRKSSFDEDIEKFHI
ncbi:RING finger protein nenya-like [Drosophila rhopaloa]|uniref:RING finger protein 212B-like n=1 Tax=Drosophila rhopaloa TaxID=1041015 RepID=A0A6P4F6L4_DRORH|nr:RING finger protein nenya-like [Drosophila rhopaloa]